MSVFRLITAVLVALGMLSLATHAEAQLAAAADVNVATPLDQDALYHHVGVFGRFGYRTGLGHASLIHTIIFQPEVVAGFTQLPQLLPVLEHRNEVRGGGGLRIGCVCGLLHELSNHTVTAEPFAFAHAYLAYAVDSGSFANPAFLFDVGAALDIRMDFLRDWSLGVHGSYDRLRHDGPHDWAELGLHAEYRWFAD